MTANADECAPLPQSYEEQASEAFVQRLQGPWTAHHQAALEARLERDAAYAAAYRHVEESWNELGDFAELPEIIARREQALVYARRSHARRWFVPRTSASRWRAFGLAAGVAAAAVAWQLSPWGYQPGLYRTNIAEQRLLELEDHSRVALDAKTRLRVRYTKDARVVRLLEGQAQFSVAADPTRPFKVEAGDQTIVALGTVFTVEYVEHTVRVAMMEGRVAVVAHNDGRTNPAASAAKHSQAAGNGIELSVGEQLHVGDDGRMAVTAPSDLAAATAWREGKVIFRGERLGDAVRRLNRYSRVQIEITDERLADREISGVFELGDTQGFLQAVQRYSPVAVEYHGSVVKLGTAQGRD